MTLSFLPEIPKIDPEKGPHLMAGVASPLWLMFGGAAMAGATWWWWSSRWREAVNIEGLMAPALPPAAEPVVDPVTEAPVLTLAPVEVPEPVAEPAPVVEAVAKAVQDTLDTVEVATAEATEAVKTAVAPVAEATVEATKAAADDLTQLVGVGPKLAASLADLGVTRFSEIAAWDADDLVRFDKALNLRGRAERDAWVAQAKRFANP
jgi:predicted flap endonuclease-1-like 5' DNA nuclease